MNTQHKGTQRARTGSDLPEHMAQANPGLNDLTREQIAHGEDRKPRIRMDSGEFNLSVPDGLIPADKKAYWFYDDGKGRLQRAKDAWWEHVVDSQGSNISRQCGANRMYLMVLDKALHEEDEKLREANYRASIGERDDKPLDGGIESYTPSGDTNKIKVTSDPFA